MKSVRGCSVTRKTQLHEYIYIYTHQYYLKHEDHENQRDDDLKEIDDERNEKVGEGELPGGDSGHPGPVHHALVALHNDDHGWVAESHGVNDCQDDA